MAAVTICNDFGVQENQVCHCFHCFPIYLPWGDGTGCLILVFWMLSFKPTFSLSHFPFIKRPFSISSLSAIRVVSSAYLRWMIFFSTILIPAVLHPAQHFSWCTLHISKISRVAMYSFDVLFSYLEPVCFSVLSSNCCFLTCIPFCIGLSRGRSGGLVFPSLEEFSTVYCDPHSQRLWHNQ